MKMKLLKFMSAGLAMTMLAGCIVLSVYPFYTDKDLVSDPGVAGSWIEGGNTNSLWQFTASGEKSYLLTTADSSSTNYFTAHVFQLKQYQFLDLLTTNRDEFELPLHLISEVSHTGTNLSLHFLDYGWLAGLLETNPAALRHIVVPQQPDDTNSDKMVYLTADTKDLQKFLLKYVGNTNAFTSDSTKELTRVAQ